MTKTQQSIGFIILGGLSSTIFGLVHTIADIHTSHGIMLGHEAHVIVGLFTILIAVCLVIIDKRLEKIENDQDSR